MSFALQPPIYERVSEGRERGREREREGGWSCMICYGEKRAAGEIRKKGVEEWEEGEVERGEGEVGVEDGWLAGL